MSAESMLSDLDKRILDRVQSQFPIADDPYGWLAKVCGVARSDAHAATMRLRRLGVIRRIGGSYVPARLGYVTSLVAADVDPARIEAAAARASRFPEVTHNYQRNTRLNLWFTVIAPVCGRVQDIASSVAQAEGVREIHALPALRTFKLRVNFEFGGSPEGASQAANPQDPGARPFALDALDRRLIARTCRDIGAGLDPYADIAEEIGAPRREVLERLRGYGNHGAMRRFGAILRHRAAGIVANGMAVLNVPEGHVDDVGKRLSARREITHCYERSRAPGWPYNVYAMIHGRRRSEVTSIAETLAQEAGLKDFRVLFSSREFKKTSMVYFADEHPPPSPGVSPAASPARSLEE